MAVPGPIRLARALAITGLRAWIITGILLRVTGLRDRFDPLAVVFYSTPWPVLAAGFVILALHHARRRDRLRVLRYAIFTAGALFTWVATSWYSAPAETTERAVRLIHWNVCKPERGFEGIAGWLKAQDADVIALTEAMPIGRNTLGPWVTAMPGYEALDAHGNMMCLVRGRILSREAGMLGPGAPYLLSQVQVRGRHLAVLQADIFARPTRSRREPLARLAALVQAHKGRNLVLVGDLNTPRESVHFKAIRSQLAHCFETAGNGFAETWPMPIPALSLDHAWAGGGLRPIRCRHGWVPRSDHMPVIVDLGE